MTDNWAVLINEHFSDCRTFSAVVVKKTAKQVVFIRPRQDERPREIKRHRRTLLVEGLTEAQANRAVERDTSSVSLRNEERKSAERRHLERRAKIMAEAAS